jgi:hypothetical protein
LFETQENNVTVGLFTDYNYEERHSNFKERILIMKNAIPTSRRETIL